MFSSWKRKSHDRQCNASPSMYDCVIVAYFHSVSQPCLFNLHRPIRKHHFINTRKVSPSMKQICWWEDHDRTFATGLLHTLLKMKVLYCCQWFHVETLTLTKGSIYWKKVLQIIKYPHKEKMVLFKLLTEICSLKGSLGTPNGFGTFIFKSVQWPQKVFGHFIHTFKCLNVFALYN